MDYTVIKELDVPERLMKLPIRSEEFINCGYTPENLPPPGTLIARIELLASWFGTGWKVEAIVRTGPRIVNCERVGEIKCNNGTDIYQVLQIANRWIRSCETAPDDPWCKTYKRRVQDTSKEVIGVTLYRG